MSSSSLSFAYGLTLRSPWPLPYSQGAAGELADVEFYEGHPRLFPNASRHERAHPSESNNWFHYCGLPDGSEHLRWANHFEFLIAAEGRRIACRSLAQKSHEPFQSYLLGQVLSFALLKHGIEPLHATAVVIDGAAIGILGNSGYGKSSLAAVFLQKGYRLLTDDVLVLKKTSAGYVAYPGPPRIKLYPEIAKRFLGARFQGTPMNNFTPKLIIPLDQRNSHSSPVNFSAFYIIPPPRKQFRTKKVSLRRLPVQEAFFKLLENTFNNHVTELQRLKRQFLWCSEVASLIPFKSLAYHRDLGSLHVVRDSILADLS